LPVGRGRATIRELLFEPWRFGHPSMQDLVTPARQLDDRIWSLRESSRTFREITNELRVGRSRIVTEVLLTRRRPTL
jgi:hypothetical protein